MAMLTAGWRAGGRSARIVRETAPWRSTSARRRTARCVRASTVPRREPGGYPDWSQCAGRAFRRGDARFDRRSRAGSCAAPTGPDARSPAITPAIFFMRRCSNSASPRGTYDRRPDDGLGLTAARSSTPCVASPPQNKPTPPEIGQLPRVSGAGDLRSAAIADHGRARPDRA